MRTIVFFFTLLGCILFGVIGSPLSHDSILAERGLEVVNEKEIVLMENGKKTEDIATVSPDDQKWIDKWTENMKARKVPFTYAIHSYYIYDPLAEGKEPTTKAEVSFWPPESEDKQQQKIMKTKLDAAKTEWKKSDIYKNFKKSLDELSEDITVSKIFGLGCGSLTALSPFNEMMQTRNQDISYIQTAILLTMQEDLEGAPKLILQDPKYGKNEIEFLEKSTSGSVEVMNDPDGFNAIDDKTIVFILAGLDSFWFRIDKGPTPVAIISESLETSFHSKGMQKPQLDLRGKYTGVEVADGGVAGLGAKLPTKFWRRLCG